VVGPPGAGKSTMCAGLARYLELAKRPCAVVNLDPACEESLTPFSVDVRNLCHLEKVMRERKLGANGALMYSLRVMRDEPWIVDKLRALSADGRWPYLIFDLPGQVELWTHSQDLRDILRSIQRAFDARLVVANVVDANHCTRPSNYVSNVLVSLIAMLNLELPHVNVLSKVDQLPTFQSSMPFHLNYFTEAVNLQKLLPHCGPGDAPVDYDDHPDDDDDDRDDDDMVLEEAEEEPPPPPRRGVQRLTAKICEVVEDFQLVCFQPLDVTDGDSVAELLRMLDKANGHPAGVYDPVRLINDPTPLFLGTEATPDSVYDLPGDDDLPRRPHVDDDDGDRASSSSQAGTKSLRRVGAPPAAQSGPGGSSRDDVADAARRWLKERR